MSPAELKVYELLYDRRNEAVSPTIAELCQSAECNSKSHIWRRLEGLEKRGYIKIERGGRGRRNAYRLTTKRPAGYGETISGFMVKDASGRFDPSSFRHFKLTPRHLPVTITIEERQLG